MSSHARARTANAMVGASSLCMLICGLWIISPDVRVHFAHVAGDPAGQLSGMVSQALAYGDVLLRMARHYGGDNTPLAGFAVVAVFLTFLMFKS